MHRRDFLKRTMLASAMPVFGSAAPDLRVTGVKIHRLSQKLKEPMGYCCASGGVLGMTAGGANVVEVATDAGITGWGDGAWGGEALRKNRSLVIGRSPFEAESIYDGLTDLSAPPFSDVPRNGA
ncbi:MAG: hypothetical protein HY235_21150 [Acidobacteria bacterium]|nr:hypothetical protein [Acidobacteriota bacterium]